MTRSIERGVRLEQRCIVPVASVDLLQVSDEARGENRSQPGLIVRILARDSELHVRSAEDCVDLHVRGSTGNLSGGSVRTSAKTSILETYDGSNDVHQGQRGHDTMVGMMSANYNVPQLAFSGVRTQNKGNL